MSTFSLKVKSSLLAILLFAFGVPSVTFASTTNGVIPAASYAWSSQDGWVNFGASQSNVLVTDSKITGYAWGENIGWINLAPSQSGVANDGTGVLSGSAWGSNVGWINFSGVSINSSGKFTGAATGPLIGTLNFDCSSCNVTTDWRPPSVRAGSGNTGGGGLGSFGSSALPPLQMTFQSTQNNLMNLQKIGVPVHALIKLPCLTKAASADPNDVCKTVYYIGTDGERHAFSNAKVYFTWYPTFDGIQIVNQTQLASISLGANITYKPGVKMVKFITVQKVYAVEKGSILRWVSTEDVAKALYGTAWNTKIDDISDAFYNDYSSGNTVSSATDYSSSAAQSSVSNPSDNLKK